MKRKWHYHFAWKPVKINCGYPHEIGTIVWLERVDRKWSAWAHWHYQLPDSKLPTPEEALIETPNYQNYPRKEI